MPRHPLKFHWRLVHGCESEGITRSQGAAVGGLANLEHQAQFCRLAEQAGMDGLLIDVGASKPDPIVLATALGMVTDRIEFIIAYRSGMQMPTAFVQQINSLSTLIDGRLSLNIVAGHSPSELRYYGDMLGHDERYQRTDEFLAVCHALWDDAGPVNFAGRHYCVAGAELKTPFVKSGQTRPEIFIAGGSVGARNLALSRGSLWMRLADTPDKIAAVGAPVLSAGKEIGLRFSVIVRSTRAKAIKAAQELVHNLDCCAHERAQERRFVGASDSVSMKALYRMADREWLSPCLWTGAVRSHGAPAIALVGTPAQVAATFVQYGQAGVSQFILSGWPKVEEMVRFGETVLPLIREFEQQHEGAAWLANQCSESH